MFKSTAIAVLLTALILLTACGGDASNFKSGQLIDLQFYEDQLSEDNALTLTALEHNLVSLVEHNNPLYQSGFVTADLADAMRYYYDDKFQYRFTDIESIVQDLPYGNVHITVLGQRLDTTTDTIEDVTMMYAFRQNDQGEWMIHTID